MFPRPPLSHGPHWPPFREMWPNRKLSERDVTHAVMTRVRSVPKSYDAIRRYCLLVEQMSRSNADKLPRKDAMIGVPLTEGNCLLGGVPPLPSLPPRRAVRWAETPSSNGREATTVTHETRQPCRKLATWTAGRETRLQ